MKLRLILASSSARRSAILQQIGVKFIVKKSNFEEQVQTSECDEQTVRNLVLFNARGKAFDVAQSISSGVIIGADTVVYFNNQVLGKPQNAKNAKKMLLQLGGKKHEVYSGVVVLRKNNEKIQVVSDYVKTDVYMRDYSAKEIDWYVGTKEPLDKAGSYGVQEKGAVLVEKVEGDFYNVVGLPINKVLELGRSIGVSII